MPPRPTAVTQIVCTISDNTQYSTECTPDSDVSISHAACRINQLMHDPQLHGCPTFPLSSCATQTHRWTFSTSDWFSTSQSTWPVASLIYAFLEPLAIGQILANSAELCVKWQKAFAIHLQHSIQSNTSTRQTELILQLLNKAVQKCA